MNVESKIIGEPCRTVENRKVGGKVMKQNVRRAERGESNL
jgi:hypothetical protein